MKADRRGDVLRLVRRASTPVGVAEIAAELGLHPNTARFHLQKLEAEGLVERDADPDGAPAVPLRAASSRTPGRPALRYRAVRAMDATGPRSYDLLARVLLDTLDESDDSRRRAAESGRRFGEVQAARRTGPGGGEQVEPVSALVVLLGDLGFAPESREEAGGVRIDLRHCPFLELATARPQAVCPVHLGLMRGALDGWGSTATVERLEVFAEPDRCVAHVSAGRGSSSG